MIHSIKGTRDILPEEVGKWQFVEDTARRIFARYGFREIRTPVFESTDLFARGIGEGTDIVSKEMYTFVDRGGRSLTLRPENTAPVVRSAIEHQLFQRVDGARLYYVGPMFRYERPQKGRMRQFHQIGVEVFGSEEPTVDAEVIEMAMSFLFGLGIAQPDLAVNSVGCQECREVFRGKFREFLSPLTDKLCQDCQRRFQENPLRILDCKKGCTELTRSAPTLLDTLDPDCRAHFDRVLSYLNLLGIGYRVEPKLVRGLDYYTRTTFEILGGSLGAQNALLGGGRYDGLVRELGGPPVAGLGFASGLERLILSIPEEMPKSLRAPDLYVATRGEAAVEQALPLIRDLRHRGFWVEMDPSPSRSLKAQSRRAGNLGARYLLFLGENELAQGIFTVKNMESGKQMELPANDIERLAQELGHA